MFKIKKKIRGVNREIVKIDKNQLNEKKPYLNMIFLYFI